MKVVVIEDAPILIPNLTHKNFTESSDIIKKGTELDGDLKYVVGMRKGEEFKYRLFYTKNGEIIFKNKIKPINMTEVKLGADAQQAPTVVSVPDNKVDKNALIGVISGAVAGFAFAAYKHKDAKEKLMYTVGVAALGYLAGKMITKRKSVTVKQ